MSFLNFGAGWGYIGVFAKVLTMYQMYHTRIHPLHCCLSSPLPQFLEQFQQVSFVHLLTCMHSICASPPQCHSLPPPLGRTYSALLFSNFVEGKTKYKKNMAFLLA
jgi:hypothetical protein